MRKKDVREGLEVVIPSSRRGYENKDNTITSVGYAQEMSGVITRYDDGRLVDEKKMVRVKVKDDWATRIICYYPSDLEAKSKDE